jgi:DNA-binding transcriptional MerR regulator
MYLIRQLTREFGLSRSTLLYYDRIGLLVPSGRTEAGYRLYSPAGRARLEAICSFRRTGLSIEEIRAVLAEEEDETVFILNHRLRKLGDEVRSLQLKQRLITGMLKAHAAGTARNH